MFKKIEVVMPQVDLEKIMGDLTHSYVGGNFQEYNIKDITYLTTLLTNNIRFGIKPHKVNITKLVNEGANTPHTDDWPVALNCYLHAGDDTTFFYTPKTDTLDHGLRSYKIDDLVIGRSFVAYTGDWYLLETRQVHNVVSADKANYRLLLRFVWGRHSFDEIVNSITVPAKS